MHKYTNTHANTIVLCLNTGELPGGQWNDLESIANLMKTFHWVELHTHSQDSAPVCFANPVKAVCMTCKGWRQNGICSHVLTVNHLLKKFNVTYNRQQIAGGKDKAKAGNMMKRIPALTKAPAPDVDDDSEPEGLPDDEDDHTTPPELEPPVKKAKTLPLAKAPKSSQKQKKGKAKFVAHKKLTAASLPYDPDDSSDEGDA